MVLLFFFFAFNCFASFTLNGSAVLGEIVSFPLIWLGFHVSWFCLILGIFLGFCASGGISSIL